MYVITGITGQIGGVIGRTLLAAAQPVRAVVRDPTDSTVLILGETGTGRSHEFASNRMRDLPLSHQNIAFTFKA